MEATVTVNPRPVSSDYLHAIYVKFGSRCMDFARSFSESSLSAESSSISAVLDRFVEEDRIVAIKISRTPRCPEGPRERSISADHGPERCVFAIHLVGIEVPGPSRLGIADDERRLAVLHNQLQRMSGSHRARVVDLQG